jgi:ABC-2 type transport system permease protein
VLDLPPPTLPPAAPGRALWRALRKYGRIYRVSLTERLVYRADFFLTTILRFLPMVTTILLWQAIYAGAGKDRDIAGFSEKQMIAYLLLVHISRMFSSMPGLAYGIARDIREGTLKKYLLQPLDMLSYLLSYRAAHKTAYIATTALPYGLLFLICRDYLAALPTPSLGVIAAYVASLILAFVIGFYFEASMGMIGFWFLEVTSLMYVVNTANFFVSGQMFPLDLLPAWLAVPLKSLPFQYLAYFPAAVLVGKIQGDAVWQGLLIELLWAVVFLILARALFRIGLRRYSAFGG